MKMHVQEFHKLAKGIYQINISQKCYARTNKLVVVNYNFTVETRYWRV